MTVLLLLAPQPDLARAAQLWYITAAVSAARPCCYSHDLLRCALLCLMQTRACVTPAADSLLEFVDASPKLRHVRLDLFAARKPGWHKACANGAECHLNV